MARIYRVGDEPVPGYRLIKLLGRGGFGEVWKVSAPGGTEAALKIIILSSTHGLKEFRAIRLVRQIHHPNLVPIHSFWLKDEEGEFLDNDSLSSSLNLGSQEMELLIAMGLGDKNLLDRLKECQKQRLAGIPRDELLDYMEQAAKAIDFLNQPRHDLGSGPVAIQHCDIKPHNIIIVGDAAQVCDFGLARVLGDSRVTQAGFSTAYVAPEVLTENQPSRWTDQYSLAITYIELRTGSLPLDMRNPSAMLYAVAQGNLKLSKVPELEQAVLRRATAVKPEQRFPSCGEMVKALRRAEAAPPPPEPVSRPPVDWNEVIQPGREIVPGYRLVRMLGKGGYGEVWEATAPGGTKVALKIVRNVEGVQGRQEFKSLELIKQLEHNHLLELYSFWLLDRYGQVIPDEVRGRPDAPSANVLVIAMKLAHKNLMDRLQECQRAGLSGIPVSELIMYMRQAAKALDYLNGNQQLEEHHVSTQHRDIKPENILLARDGTVKIGDFGLIKVVEETQAVINPDSAGLTLAYAAPEMFASLVTSWTDQYALALTYFKLRTGVLPFSTAMSPHALISAHLHHTFDLSAMPAGEAAVIDRATAVTPEARFPTCVEMVRALEKSAAYKAEDPTLVPEPVILPSPPTNLLPGLHPPDVPTRPPTVPEPVPSTHRSKVSPVPSVADSETSPPVPVPVPARAPGHDMYATLDPAMKSLQPIVAPARIAPEKTAVSPPETDPGPSPEAATLPAPHPTARPKARKTLDAPKKKGTDAPVKKRTKRREPGTETQTPPPPSPPPQDTEQKRRRRRIKIVISVTVLAVVFALVGVLGVQVVIPRLFPNNLQAKVTSEVEDLLGKGRYEEAYDLVLSHEMADLESRVATAWLEAAREQEQRGEFKEVYQTTSALLEKVRENQATTSARAGAAELRQDAAREILVAEVKEQIGDHQYAKAADRLKNEGGSLKSARRQHLNELLFPAWFEYAKHQKKEVAKSEMQTLLAKLPNDPREFPGSSKLQNTVTKFLAMPGWEEKIQAAIQKGEQSLIDGEATKALEAFKEARELNKEYDDSSLGTRATVGVMRAYGLQKEWSKAWDALKNDPVAKQEVEAKPAYKAYVRALEVLEAKEKPGTERSALHEALFQLKKPDDLFGLLDKRSPEYRGIDNLAQGLIAEFLKENETHRLENDDKTRQADEAALRLADQFLDFAPRQFGILLVKAYKQYRLGDLPGSQKTLKDAEQAAATAASKTDLDKLHAQQALVWARSTEANAVEAAKLLRELLAAKDAPWPVELAQAYADVAERSKDLKSQIGAHKVLSQSMKDYPSERVQLTRIQGSLDSTITRTAVAQAKREFDSSEFAKCIATANQAAEIAGSSLEGKDLQALKALALARRDNGDLDSKEAVRLFVLLIPDGQAPRRLELCRAYLALAKKHEGYQEDMWNTLDKVKEVWQGDNAIVAGLGDLGGLRFKKLLAAARNKERELRDRRKDLSQAREIARGDQEKAEVEVLEAILDIEDRTGGSGAVQKLQASLRRSPIPLPEELCQALADLADRDPELLTGAVGDIDDARVNLPQNARPYAYYARALVYQKQGKLDLAAKDLLEAFPDGAMGLKSAPRRERAVNVLQEAARKLRTNEGLSKPFSDPDKAFVWLHRARTLWTEGKDLPLSSRANLALAAWNKKNRDAVLARQLTAELLQIQKARPGTLDDEDVYPILLVHARAHAESPKDQEAALLSYETILELVKKKGTQAIADEDLYKEVLKPATTLGDSLIETKPLSELKKRVAAFHAAQGHLIRDRLNDGWVKDMALPPLDVSTTALLGSPLGQGPLLATSALFPSRETLPNPLHAVYEAYRRAFELDTKAEYLVGRVYTRSELPNPDWKELLKDTDRAQGLDPDLPGVYGLRGYVLLLKSRQEPERSATIDDLRASLIAFNEALQRKGKERDAEYATILTASSSSHLELGNYLTDRKERVAHFNLAATQALDATEPRLKHPYPERAWVARGNALEDIAWFFGDKDKYALAIDAFEKAIPRPTRWPQPWLGRGRCRYRWVVSGAQSDTKRTLDAAVQDLKDAIAKAPDSPEVAEAWYWLALIAQQPPRPKLARADECFANAVKLARNGQLRVWLEFALEGRAQVALDQKNATAARDRAGELQTLNAPGAARIRGRSFELDQDAEKALEAYDRALPKLSEVGPEHVLLILDRAAFLLSDLANKLPAGSQPKFRSLLPLLDQAAKVTPDRQLRAAARGRAGIIRYRVTLIENGAADKNDLQDQALKDFADAIGLAPKHEDGWIWRWLWVATLDKQDQRTDEQLRQASDWIIEAHDAAKALPDEYKEYREAIEVLYKKYKRR
jgi:serine/threonine protein kinase